MVPVHVAKTAFLALIGLCIGRGDLSSGLVGGLVWNLREMRQTRRRRLAVARTNSGERNALQRIYRGWLALEHLRRFGLPTFVDEGSRVGQQ
jgi:hypothetical protein